MKLLPHYVATGQDTINIPVSPFRYGWVADWHVPTHTSKQSSRQLEQSGVGWLTDSCLVYLPLPLRLKRWARWNAFSPKTNKQLKKKSRWAAGGLFSMSLKTKSGTLTVCQQGGWGEGGWREEDSGQSWWQLSTQVMWFLDHLLAEWAGCCSAASPPSVLLTAQEKLCFICGKDDSTVPHIRSEH